jgi:hypothetical protein
MYTKIYLRLEPLGLELVAQAVRQAGHEVRILDLQTETSKDYVRGACCRSAALILKFPRTRRYQPCL